MMGGAIIRAWQSISPDGAMVRPRKKTKSKIIWEDDKCAPGYPFKKYVWQNKQKIERMVMNGS